MYRWATTKTWVVYNTLSSHPLLFFNNVSNLSISQKSWVCADQWKRLWLSVPHFKYSPKSFLFDTTALDESVAMALVGEMLYTYIICSKHIIVIIIVASFWGGRKGIKVHFWFIQLDSFSNSSKYHQSSNYDFYARILLLGSLGVSKKCGTPKWMVYNGKPY